ncbi:unnamed protein product [Gadus morhua 'NCC']
MQRNRGILFSHVCCSTLLCFWIAVCRSVVLVEGSPQGIPLSVVKLWASAFGGEIKSLSAKYSGSQLLQKKYKEFEKSVRVEEIDGVKLVKNLAVKMEEMFRKKAEATRRLVEAAEEAHHQHEENPDLEYEYFNAVLINKLVGGKHVELGGEFLLEENAHFDNLPVNLSLSVVQLGIHGYAFAVTNNGYILTHPDLRPMYQQGKKRRKPNYSSVDLSEVEWEDKDDILRNAMVNRRTGTFSMEVKRTVDKGKRVLKMHNDYYYTDIKGTPFSVGVALSRGHGKYFFRGNVSVEAGLHDLEQPDVALADEWTYCNTDEHLEHRPLTQIQAIRLFLTGRQPHLKCDRELIQEVLFDAVITAPLEAYWTGLALNKSENSDKGVEIAYLGTRTGLSRTNLFVVPELLSNQDFLTAEDKEGVFNADHFPLWYKRAAEQVPGTFVYSVPFSSASENKSVVLASTAIQLLDDRKSPIVAAVGIQMKLEYFQRKFWTACRQCTALDGRCSISCESGDINCYLIDNNGFILVTEEISQTGLFFGEVEGAVMNKLLQMGSFKRITLYDYQAHCRDYAGSSDCARTLLNPFSVVKWILTEVIIFLLEFNFYSWWNVGLSVKAQRPQGKTKMVPCDTEYPAFVSERTIKETTGNIDCEGCFRSFVIQQIPSSNLFMVVVENKCDCSSAPPVTIDPIEIMYILDSIKTLKFQKDRKKPESCHPFHPEENAMECGSATGLSSTLTAALFPLLTSLISR